MTLCAIGWQSDLRGKCTTRATLSDIEALFVEMVAVESIRKWLEQHGVEP